MTLSDAILGEDYSADLPPFSDAAGATGLALHVEPNPPAGLTFADLGSGFGQISGKAAAVGRFVFEVIATNEAGVAPAPAPTPSPTQPPSPVEKARAFLRGFDGGACFATRGAGALGDPLTIEAIGSDEAIFRRFYNSFIKEVGVEPNVTARTIAVAACPAIEMIRASRGDRSNAPKIDLAAFDIGKGKPLAGAVSNLAGRHLDLLVITNDGLLHRLDTKPQAGGGSATFNQPLSADANSLAALQILIAIAAPNPPPSLDGFKHGAVKDIMPRLRADLADPSGMVEFEFFRLVN